VQTSGDNFTTWSEDATYFVTIPPRSWWIDTGWD
jgi:hypothetical protein